MNKLVKLQDLAEDSKFFLIDDKCEYQVYTHFDDYKTTVYRIDQDTLGLLPSDTSVWVNRDPVDGVFMSEDMFKNFSELHSECKRLREDLDKYLAAHKDGICWPAYRAELASDILLTLIKSKSATPDVLLAHNYPASCVKLANKLIAELKKENNANA